MKCVMHKNINYNRLVALTLTIHSVSGSGCAVLSTYAIAFHISLRFANYISISRMGINLNGMPNCNCFHEDRKKEAGGGGS